MDELWVPYGSAGVAVSDRVYLHADHQGSIIARSNSAGAVVTTAAYDAYGVAKDESTDSSGFGYTGQIYFKSLELDYYKARFYSPKLGRFLQTDPIGYKDDMDLYSYVGNDPVNKSDPSGLEAATCPPGASCYGSMYSAGYYTSKVNPAAIAKNEIAKAKDAAITIVEAALVVGAVVPVVGELEAGVIVSGGLPVAAAAIDQVAIRTIETGVRTGATSVPINAGAQLRAVAEALKNKIVTRLESGKIDAAKHVQQAGNKAINTLDRFDVLTPEARQQLRDIVNSPF